jgi:hypothetical protein
MGDALVLHSKLVEATKALDNESTRSLIAPDFVIYEDESLPFGGSYHGPDGFIELCQKVWTAFGGPHFEVLYRLEEHGGNRMCTVNRFVAKTNAGRPIEALVNEVWEFRDGKAVEARVWYFGATDIARAMAGD